MQSSRTSNNRETSASLGLNREGEGGITQVQRDRAGLLADLLVPWTSAGRVSKQGAQLVLGPEQDRDS